MGWNATVFAVAESRLEEPKVKTPPARKAPPPTQLLLKCPAKGPPSQRTEGMWLPDGLMHPSLPESLLPSAWKAPPPPIEEVEMDERVNQSEARMQTLEASMSVLSS